MKIGTWIFSLVQPLIGRILTAIGFSVVTITGFDVAITAAKNQLITSVNSLPGDVLSIFLLGGGGIGLGMITAAIATRLLLWQISNATRILGVNPQ
ncbi:DUF2523 domain-containing protein [Paracidovorax konjaci]|uniref:DUF2523 domain-containing protein n=1 Tax=Paracidovorax konjaci TaxID=32040 RepID=UPI000B87F39C|nr:DUF2523 domain-containing protein [Paracidovorax konjaci]